MANRADYRTTLRDLLVGLEYSGYGNFEFTDQELNTFLEMAAARLFPEVHVRKTTAVVNGASYGTAGNYSATISIPESRVFMVEDSVERQPLYGWSTRPSLIVGLCPLDTTSTTFYVHYYEAYEMPSDDVTTITLPAEYKVLVATGAALEAMASRRDSGDRPDPPTGQEMGAFDRLVQRYETLRRDLAMNLPAVIQ